jgi:hypothetical protein
MLFLENLPNIIDDISEALDESLEENTDIATEDIKVEVINGQGAASQRRVQM